MAPVSPLAQARSTLADVPATRALVGLSGKDALCTLDLCIEHFGVGNVQAFTMVLVRDLECEWAHIRRVQGRYKGLEVHQVFHWKLAEHLRRGIYRDYSAEAAKAPVLKQKDIENDLRQKTGIAWVALGMRCSDSLVRNAYLKGPSCVNFVAPREKRFFPIASWKKRDVYGYLHAKKLPVPPILGGGTVNGGVSLYGETLAWIEERHPDDFRKILEVFPYARAGVLKYRRDEALRVATNAENEKARAAAAAAAAGKEAVRAVALARSRGSEGEEEPRAEGARPEVERRRRA